MMSMMMIRYTFVRLRLLLLLLGQREEEDEREGERSFTYHLWWWGTSQREWSLLWCNPSRQQRNIRHDERCKPCRIGYNWRTMVFGTYPTNIPRLLVLPPLLLVGGIRVKDNHPNVHPDNNEQDGRITVPPPSPLLDPF